MNASLKINSSELQTISRKMVGAEVQANVGTLVEYILKQDDSNAPFSYEDINLYPDVSEWDSTQINEWLAEQGLTWWDVTNVEFNGFPSDQEYDEARQYIQDNMEPVEVYEWWDVSEWLEGKLSAAGEVTFYAGGMYIWGRSTTGQAVYMDYCIQEIARKFS